MNLQKLATDFKYSLIQSGDYFRFEDNRSRVALCLERTGEDTVFAYFYARTTSWDFGGERTDLNDALSVLAVMFLRFFGVSCSLWDIPHRRFTCERRVLGRLVDAEHCTQTIG
jgi:hypothetical protein